MTDFLEEAEKILDKLKFAEFSEADPVIINSLEPDVRTFITTTSWASELYHEAARKFYLSKLESLHKKVVGEVIGKEK